MNKKLIIVGIIFIILAVGLSGCNEQDQREIPREPLPCFVRYEVTGTAKEVSLTYVNQDGGTEQKTRVRLPTSESLFWSDGFGEFPFLMREGDWVYLSAQNMGESGSVTVKIYYNDVIFKKATSSGAYVIATVSGFISRP